MKCQWCGDTVPEELHGVSEPGYQGWFCDKCFEDYLNDELEKKDI